MIKKVFICCFLFLIIGKSYAQGDRVEYLPSFDKEFIHYGFYLGLNKNDFKMSLQPSAISNPEILIEPTIGFNAGVILDFRLHKNINLRFEPGLMSNAKTIRFNHFTEEKDILREVSSTFIHLPLLLKFSTDRLHNVRPYVIGGVSYDHNLSSNQDNNDDNFNGEFRTTTNNLMYEVGIGVDFYLYFFKFSPSIRGVFAMNNELKYDNSANSGWTAPINYLGTRGIFLHLSFE